jgi:hypothetical protein
MGLPLHNTEQSHEITNLCKILNFDIRDLHPERRWLPDSDDFLIELYQQGKTIDVMSREMNRPEWIIVGRIWELRKRGRLKPEMRGCRAKGEVRGGPLDR